MRRPKVKPKRDEEFTTIRLSLTVRLYLEQNSINYRREVGRGVTESVDEILRRLLDIKDNEG